MFALTRKTDYAIIALSHMARHDGEVCNAREIAERFHLPPAMLMNLMKRMAQADLIRSIRGPKGGYVLALSPREISLDVVVRAIEGPPRLVQCVEPDGESEKPTCELLHTCPVSGPVRKIQARLEALLREVTLDDLVRDPDYNACCRPAEVAAPLGVHPEAARLEVDKSCGNEAASEESADDTAEGDVLQVRMDGASDEPVKD